MKHINLYEQFLNESKNVKGSEIVKMMKNTEDWGDSQDQVYTKGNNMIY